MNNRQRKLLTFKPSYSEGRPRAIGGRFIPKSTAFCLAAVAAACLVATHAYAQTPPGVTLLGPGDRTFLQQFEFPDGQLTTSMYVLRQPANREVARHMHPGVEMGYVLEGSIEFRIGDAPPKTVSQGESFMVPAYTPHSGKFGPNGVKALAILMLEKDKPVSIPVP
jgi:quercetin dioxygenase-like cupin family protein